MIVKWAHFTRKSYITWTPDSFNIGRVWASVKFDNSKSLSLMFAWQIPFTFPALLFCLHYWVMLTVINNKYSILCLDIEGCWNEVAPSSCWTNFVLYDLCVLLYCVNVMLFQRRFITETYIKGSIKKCKAATSSFS